MKGAIFRLVLLVSSAHALVHVYELAYPSVEQLVAATFRVDERVSGALGACWRLPFGLFAVFAGWLTDRYGAKRTLVGYLLGCSLTSLLAAAAPDLWWLFIAFFLMGTFASVYHPAGLALISHAVPAEDHPRALSIHGIFGSVGIAVAPFLAAPVLSAGAGWRTYFALLSLPGVALGVVFLLALHDRWSPAARGKSSPEAEPSPGTFLARQYCVTLLIIILGGLIYGATMTFMPRYLDDTGLSQRLAIPPAGMRNYLTAGVLLLGAGGQYLAGRIARSNTLQPCLAATYLLMAPCLLWMGVAEQTGRIAAAAAFSVVFFMSQPVYNSLIPKYVPPARRSLGYGFSFVVNFGIGSSLGALFSGMAYRWQLFNYGTLAVAAALGGLLALLLWAMDRSTPDLFRAENR